METLASFQMSGLLIHTQNGGVQSCCQLLQDHISTQPRHTGEARLPFFGVDHQPLLSRVFQEEELHQGCGHGRLCPLLRGVRRAGPHPNAAQLGCTLLKCGIMGELYRPGEREGLFLGMPACVFGPRSSVKSNLTAHLTVTVPSCCLKHTFGACTAVFLLTWLRVRRLSRVYRVHCYHMCPSASAVQVILGEITSQTEALLIWDPESVTSGGFGEGLRHHMLSQGRSPMYNMHNACFQAATYRSCEIQHESPSSSSMMNRS